MRCTLNTAGEVPLLPELGRRAGDTVRRAKVPGIAVAVVDGDRVRNIVPGYVEAQGEDGALSPAAIGENYWQLHKQHRSVWTHELDLRPFKENW